MTTLCQKQI